jgi:hypothetical protein
MTCRFAGAARWDQVHDILPVHGNVAGCERISRLISRISVVLPQPEGPMKRRSPSGTLRLMLYSGLGLPVGLVTRSNSITAQPLLTSFFKPAEEKVGQNGHGRYGHGASVDHGVEGLGNPVENVLTKPPAPM